MRCNKDTSLPQMNDRYIRAAIYTVANASANATPDIILTFTLKKREVYLYAPN